MRVGIDTSPLVQNRGREPRVSSGACSRCAARPPRRVSSSSSPSVARARVSSLVRDALWYPVRLGLDRPPRRPPTARPFGARSAPAWPTVLTVHDLAILRAPEAFPRWHCALRPAGRPESSGCRRRSSRSPSSPGPRPSSSRACRRIASASWQTGSTPSSGRPAPRAEGDYVLAVATLEPRKNLVARSTRHASSASSCAWSVLAAGGSRRRGWVGEIPDSELAALYRGARCSSTRRCTRVSACPYLRRWLAEPPS